MRLVGVFHQLPGRRSPQRIKFMSLVEPEWAKRQAKQRNASPDRALGTPHLRSMLSTAELIRRPSRPPDYAAENRALIVLAQGDGDLPGRCSAEARGYRP